MHQVKIDAAQLYKIKSKIVKIESKISQLEGKNLKEKKIIDQMVLELIETINIIP